MQGVIKKLVLEKGYGFISGGRGDVFFHHSTVVDSRFDDLQEGQPVEYEIDENRRSDRGPRAGRVRPT